LNRENIVITRPGALARACRSAVAAAAVLAAAGLSACTPTASDLAYPDLSQAPVRAVPANLMTEEERDAAISELRAEAASVAPAE
jgi:hypothetical protein